MNPWEIIDLQDYEKHMKLNTVQQVQVLNLMMKDQIYRYNIKTLCILGVAGGNGLDHIQRDKIDKVYGVDINGKYLSECNQRYCGLSNTLKLIHANLLDINNIILPHVELVIANLLIEYIGIDIFLKNILKMNAHYVSVVIQVNHENTFVSDSPYLEALSCLDTIHHDVNQEELIINMCNSGYLFIYEERIEMPNKKELVRLDFKNASYNQ